MFGTTLLIILASSQLFANIVICAPLPSPHPSPDNSNQIDNSYSGAGGNASGGSVTTSPNTNGLSSILGEANLVNVFSGRDSHDSRDRFKQAYHPTQATEDPEAPQILETPCTGQAPSPSVLGHPPLPIRMPALEARRVTMAGTHIVGRGVTPKEETSAVVEGW